MPENTDDAADGAERPPGDIFSRRRAVMRWILAAFFTAAGIAHLMAPDALLSITPSSVPFAQQVIAVTGLCEIAVRRAGHGIFPLRGRHRAGDLCAVRVAREFQARHRRYHDSAYRQ